MNQSDPVRRIKREGLEKLQARLAELPYLTKEHLRALPENGGRPSDKELEQTAAVAVLLDPEVSVLEGKKLTQKDVALLLRIDPATVSKLRQRAEEWGWLWSRTTCLLETNEVDVVRARFRGQRASESERRYRR